MLPFTRNNAIALAICYGTGISKIWSSLDCLVTLLFGRYILPWDTHTHNNYVASLMSCAMSNHSLWLSSDSGSSYSMLCYCNFCTKTLALSVTGDNIPSGSNTLDDSLSTSCFVTKVEATGIDDLHMRDSVSVWVSNCIPNTLIVLLPSATLSCVTRLVSLWLLDAQLLQLNCALFIFEQAVL